MNVRVAGVTVSLTGLDDDLARMAEKRYSRFLSDSVPAVSIAASMRRRKRSPIGDAVVDARIDAGSRADVFRFSARNRLIEGDVDLSEGLGYVSMPPDLSCVDDVLCIVYSLLLMRDDVLLVQSATPAVGHIVMLVVGESDLDLPHVPATSQIVAVRRMGDAFLAFPTPFGGQHAENIDEASPISAVYLLRPGAANEVRPPQEGAALLELLNRTCFFGPPDAAETAVDLAADLLAKRFIGEFRWRPDFDQEADDYTSATK